MPYAKQGEDSANCGPCTLKMLVDYYNVRNPDGRRYSVASLNRLLNVSSEFGCEKSDVVRTLKRLGLKRERVDWRNLHFHLKKRKPVLSLFIDEDGIGHYSVIKGADKKHLLFHDPYWGKDIARDKKQFKNQARRFGDWLWAISK
jgi:ABC-type bacteriocin/lantibiotic exporter with double-glycine peptidase domain